MSSPWFVLLSPRVLFGAPPRLIATRLVRLSLANREPTDPKRWLRAVRLRLSASLLDERRRVHREANPEDGQSSVWATEDALTQHIGTEGDSMPLLWSQQCLPSQ